MVAELIYRENTDLSSSTFILLHCLLLYCLPTSPRQLVRLLSDAHFWLWAFCVWGGVVRCYYNCSGAEARLVNISAEVALLLQFVNETAVSVKTPPRAHRRTDWERPKERNLKTAQIMHELRVCVCVYVCVVCACVRACVRVSKFCARI